MGLTEQMDKEQIEGLLDYLETKEADAPDGEEIFSDMLDDMLYLVALMDTQHSLLRLALSDDGGNVPESLWEFARELMGKMDETLEKWETYAQPFA